VISVAGFYTFIYSTGGEGNGVKEAVGNLEVTSSQIIVALIALIGTCVSILGIAIRNGSTAKEGLKQATQANSAVNNIGPGEHRLYDKVKHIEEAVTKLVTLQEQFDAHGWETLPPDLNTAVGLTVSIRDLQNHYASTQEKLDQIILSLQEHVEWEMQAKYQLEHKEMK